MATLHPANHHHGIDVRAVLRLLSLSHTAFDAKDAWLQTRHHHGAYQRTGTGTLSGTTIQSAPAPLHRNHGHKVSPFQLEGISAHGLFPLLPVGLRAKSHDLHCHRRHCLHTPSGPPLATERIRTPEGGNCTGRG